MANTQTIPWMFIVDEGGGRLMHARSEPTGRMHLEVADRLKNEWKQHEHGRPTGLSRTEVGTRQTGVSKTTYQFAQPRHEDEELRHEFAKETARWLEKKITQHGIDHLAVFAAPKLLGELRKVWPKSIASMIHDHDQDLSWMGEEELLKHPAVMDLLGAGDR